MPLQCAAHCGIWSSLRGSVALPRLRENFAKQAEEVLPKIIEKKSRENPKCHSATDDKRRADPPRIIPGGIEPEIEADACAYDPATNEVKPGLCPIAFLVFAHSGGTWKFECLG